MEAKTSKGIFITSDIAQMFKGDLVAAAIFSQMRFLAESNDDPRLGDMETDFSVSRFASEMGVRRQTASDKIKKMVEYGIIEFVKDWYQNKKVYKVVGKEGWVKKKNNTNGLKKRSVARSADNSSCSLSGQLPARSADNSSKTTKTNSNIIRVAEATHSKTEEYKFNNTIYKTRKQLTEDRYRQEREYYNSLSKDELPF